MATDSQSPFWQQNRRRELHLLLDEAQREKDESKLRKVLDLIKKDPDPSVVLRLKIGSNRGYENLPQSLIPTNDISALLERYSDPQVVTNFLNMPSPIDEALERTLSS